MKIMMFGASGKTGQLLLELLLAKDNQVTVYARNIGKIDIDNQKLTLIEGSVLDVQLVESSMKGHDVVVSCLGGDDNKQSTSLTNMLEVITQAMTNNGISRIVHISTAGIHKEFSFFTQLLVNLLLKNAIADHKGAASIIMDKGLDYTIARPMSLTDGPLTKQYRTATVGVPKGGRAISRADLADFMEEAIMNHTHQQETVGLAY